MLLKSLVSQGSGWGGEEVHREAKEAGLGVKVERYWDLHGQVALLGAELGGEDNAEVHLTPQEQPVPVLAEAEEPELALIPQEEIPAVDLIPHPVVKVLIHPPEPKEPVARGDPCPEGVKHPLLPAQDSWA